MSYYIYNGRPGLYLEIGRRSMSRRCEMCGTPVDDSDYQDDGYRHTDGRCTEYLKAALGAANRHAEGLAKLATHLQSELDAMRRVADAARAYVGSDDEDRVEEFDALVSSLKGLKP